MSGELKIDPLKGDGQGDKAGNGEVDAAASGIGWKIGMALGAARVAVVVRVVT